MVDRADSTHEGMSGTLARAQSRATEVFDGHT